MLRDKRCDEIKESPETAVIKYFECGWLGGVALKTALKNVIIYSNSRGQIRNLLDKGTISETDYVLAAEECFLYGKIGFSTWKKCTLKYLLYKIYDMSPLDASEMFFESERAFFSGNEEKFNKSSIANLKEIFRTRGFDKKHFWVFDAGDKFQGNPKWLFHYINNYRPDIVAVWLTDLDDTVQRVRELGYNAFKYGTKDAEQIKDMAGVYVVENVKEHIPSGLENTVMLNLFHGVGCKRIERNLHNAFFSDKLACKYIRYNEYYLNNMIVLVTSPFIEKDFKFQMSVDDDMVIRAGYPRCMYQKYFNRIENIHRFPLAEKNLPESTRLAIYAPTYRYSGDKYFFDKALPSLERLDAACREAELLMILKLHPLLEGDPQFVNAQVRADHYSNLLFWDNRDDIYEIMDKIDLAVVDYSSIFTDMVGVGIKHFIRYIFDYDKEKDSLDLMYDYFSVTSGKICNSFEELLGALKNYQENQNKDELNQIKELYWKYEEKSSMDYIIQKAIDFEPKHKKLPILYSYDIFDTIISRKVLEPNGIFFYVKDKIKKSEVTFPSEFINNYPKIRENCEKNERFRRIRNMSKPDDRREIYFKDIFDNMQEVYGISEKQANLLMKWEQEAEIENVIPLSERIDEIKQHIRNLDKVVFISDMYLPLETIKSMLVKADKELANIPIFLSGNYGVQKTTGLLYMEVYKSIEKYNFKEWLHCGDNPYADVIVPTRNGIHSYLVQKLEFSDYEKGLVQTIGTYDAYLIAGCFARFRSKHTILDDIFAHNYVSLYFVPYILHVVEDAEKKGIQTLYFVSRDGHHLKRIADTIISMRGCSIKTKYLYASRNTWRMQSFIECVDDEFYSGYGNFAEINSFEDFLDAAYLSIEQFVGLFKDFEEFTYKNDITAEDRKTLIEALQNSKEYETYLLELSAQNRLLSQGYLDQEIDFSEKLAVVEYWGRGYTQDCFVRLVNDLLGYETDIPFYYVRTIDKSYGKYIKWNYSANPADFIFIEALFANIPYKSIASYEKINGHIVPVLEKREYDKNLYEAMEEYIVSFTKELMKLPLLNFNQTMSSLFDYALDYFSSNYTDEVFSKCLGDLTDCVGTHGKDIIFARPVNQLDVESILLGGNTIKGSRNSKLSYANSLKIFQAKINEIYQGENNIFDGAYRLNKYQLEQSNKLTVEKNKFEELLDIMQRKYLGAISSIKVLPQLVLIIAADFDAEEFYSLKKRFEDCPKLVLRFMKYTGGECTDEQLMLIASAKYIITSSNKEIISMLKIRKETVVICIMDIAFAFIKIARSRKFKIQVEQELHLERTNTKYDYISVASDATGKILRDSYLVVKEASIISFGSCVTDIYFDPEFIRLAKRKVEEGLPEHLRLKKKILYMPLHRYRNAGCKYLNFLDLGQLLNELNEDYIVLFAPEKRSLQDIDKDYLNDERIVFTGDSASLREQIITADIIVGDYRHSFFEAALLDKPVFCTSADAKSIEASSQVFCLYSDIQPGPCVKDAHELAEQIKKIDNYDDTLRKKFADKYLCDCQGVTADKLISFLETID